MRKKNPELYQAIKTYVERHYEKDGRSPTVREIEAGTGITRPTVQRYLTAMRESGEIEYNGVSVIIPRRECIQTLNRKLRQKRAQN